MAAPRLPPPGGAAPTSGTVAVEEVARRPRRRRSADRDGATADEPPAVPEQEYECRFCFTKFKKSQALGGHMNRHRQEREKEQYHHAQQLVSSMAQQQMPRTWNSLAAATEMTQSTSAPGGALSNLSSQLTGGHMRQQFPGPPYSYPSYRGPLHASNSSSPSSNYYLSSNSSSCNNLQNLHWPMDGGGLSNAGTPRSAPPTATFQGEQTSPSCLQVPSDNLNSIFRVPATNIDNSLVSSSNPTGTPPGSYDLYPPYSNSYLGGM